MRKILGTVVGCLAFASVLAPTSAEARLYSGPSGLKDVRGAIEAEWLRLDGPGWGSWTPGRPLTNETRTPWRDGAYNHFERGSIYWAPSTGAHEVRGAIRDRWAAQGWENGTLGFPVTSELNTLRGDGKYNHFQGGSIFWSPSTGAQEVRGAIRALWTTLGSETGFLGYPVTNEIGTPNGRGRFNHFQGGSIYWSATTGVHEVHGAIRAKWAALGWEAGPLGFPVTSETIDALGGGRYNDFQFGSVYWSPSTGAHEVRGAIRAAWDLLGAETSLLGYPVSDEYAVPGGRRSDFQYGSLVWNPVEGAVQDIVLSGSGDATIPILTGPFVLGVSADSSGQTLVEVSKPPDWPGRSLVAWDDGSWSQTVLVNVPRPGAAELHVTSDGDWTLDLTPLSWLPPTGPDDVVSGSQGTVLRYSGPPGQLLFDTDDPHTNVDVFSRDGTLVGTTVWVVPPATVPVGGDVILDVNHTDLPWTLVVEPD